MSSSVVLDSLFMKPQRHCEIVNGNICAGEGAPASFIRERSVVTEHVSEAEASVAPPESVFFLAQVFSYWATLPSLLGKNMRS